MIYFALDNDGLLYNLGDHGDFDSADYCAKDMEIIDPYFLFDDDQARSIAGFIQDTLDTTETTR